MDIITTTTTVPYHRRIFNVLCWLNKEQASSFIVQQWIIVETSLSFCSVRWWCDDICMLTNSAQRFSLEQFSLTHTWSRKPHNIFNLWLIASSSQTWSFIHCIAFYILELSNIIKQGQNNHFETIQTDIILLPPLHPIYFLP